MSNDFFTKTGTPASGSFGSSSAVRAEFASVEAGFDKLPALTGNAGEIVAVNAGATALEAITTTGTGSGMRATSPLIVTPTLAGYAPRADIGNVASGGTVTLQTGFPQYINIGGGTKAALTFNLPTASLVDNQVQRVATVGAITAVTISGGVNTVSGAPTTLAANGFFTLQYVLSQTTWYRVG